MIGLVEHRHFAEEIGGQAKQHGRHREEHDAEEDLATGLCSHAGHQKMQAGETRDMHKGSAKQQPVRVETQPQQRGKAAAFSSDRQLRRSRPDFHATFPL